MSGVTCQISGLTKLNEIVAQCRKPPDIEGKKDHIAYGIWILLHMDPDHELRQEVAAKKINLSDPQKQHAE